LGTIKRKSRSVLRSLDTRNIRHVTLHLLLASSSSFSQKGAEVRDFRLHICAHTHVLCWLRDDDDESGSIASPSYALARSSTSVIPLRK
jgi:hypothetical protein